MTYADQARPPIQMSESDADRLSELAATVEARLPEVAGMLLDEIERAQIVAAAAMPQDVIRMHSTVAFADDGSGRQRTIQLVYPAEADIDQGRVSILTPVGAGLIGLRTGQSISWPDRNGHVRLLRIVSVTQAAA